MTNLNMHFNHTLKYILFKLLSKYETLTRIICLKKKLKLIFQNKFYRTKIYELLIVLKNTFLVLHCMMNVIIVHMFDENTVSHFIKTNHSEFHTDKLYYAIYYQ